MGRLGFRFLALALVLGEQVLGLLAQALGFGQFIADLVARSSSERAIMPGTFR